jgi:site-specific recombinase XerD
VELPGNSYPFAVVGSVLQRVAYRIHLEERKYASATINLRLAAVLYHLAGGELDQIQFLLGHVSIQTTERYLGCNQKLRIAVDDRLGIEPDAS